MNRGVEVTVNQIVEVRSPLIQMETIEMKVMGKYTPEVSQKGVQKHKMIKIVGLSMREALC